MIYVDWLCNHGWRLYGKPILSCHLFGDTEKELLEFGEKIGLKKTWLQKKSIVHFDLTESKRNVAILYGATELNRISYMELIRKLRNESKGFKKKA